MKGRHPKTFTEADLNPQSPHVAEARGAAISGIAKKRQDAGVDSQPFLTNTFLHGEL